MEEFTTENPSEVATSVQCRSESEPTLMTSNVQVVLAIFGVSLVIAIVTVSANCVIIMAIVRAYIFGISSPGQGSRKTQATGPGGAVQRTRLGTDSSNIPIALMVSMAVTDTLLGAIIMPLYSLEILYYGQWPLGNVSCKLRMYLDIVLSVSSIYHVTCMALDRYLAICRPFFHQKLSVRTGVLAVVLCWAAPVAITLLFHVPEESGTRVVRITSPECLDMEISEETSTDVNSERNNGHAGSIAQIPEVLVCVQQFSPIFHAITLTMNFYIPFIAIVVFYSLILFEISKLSRRRLYLKGGSQHQPVSKTVGRNQRDLNSIQVISSSKNCAPNSGSTIQPSSENSEPNNLAVVSSNPRRTNYSGAVGMGNDPTSSVANGDKVVDKPQLARTKSRRATTRSLKAAQTVSLVVMCFLVCWLPFSVYILYCTVTQEQGPYQLMMVILWLGYLNSCLNPMLYCGHVTIKAALKDLIWGKQRKHEI